jgi:hypothetical protein
VKRAPVTPAWCVVISRLNWVLILRAVPDRWRGLPAICQDMERSAIVSRGLIGTIIGVLVVVILVIVIVNLM